MVICTEHLKEQDLVHFQNFIKALNLETFRFIHTLKLFNGYEVKYEVSVEELNKLQSYLYPTKQKSLSKWKKFLIKLGFSK